MHANIDIMGHSFIHCDSVTRAGGVALYIKNNINFDINSSLSCELASVEDLWINILTNSGTLAVGVVYRHPVNNADELDEFTNKMRDIFHSLNHNNTDFIISGNFNIDLLQTANNNHFRKYANNLLGCSCKCVINAPTRISKTSKTSLDHIYVPSNTAVEHQIFGGIALCDITDHLPVFAIKSARLKSAASNRRSVYTRDFSNFEPTLFTTYLQQQLELFDYSNKSTVNEKLKQFKVLLENSINEFAPLKKSI